ncbi:CRISPR-associated protein Cas1 [Methanolacinia petrolearia DSM 11571]|uniref:CRISPR-associated endonuclease Cas1 n=1 Tax=Methanolacinia petrolearia (strain DSM 11571 / OCM 486 / SEBR 4847) TaxID=679926 RepID=E1RGH0_METP4|nr:CRISPR-associated endonuclease Cas1 [Methanolacinia petrolearia]ADN35181.1 CRISPR-associated protein Cas1 [Methanolacinia petrolearia DSM 11571]
MFSPDIPWHVVWGFGGHIKSTATTLIILNKSDVEEIPIKSVDHLLVVGGHNIHTSAIIHLLRQNSSVSFFDADGTPVGVLRPFGRKPDEEMAELQSEVSSYNSAAEIVRSSIKARIMMIEKAGGEIDRELYYKGEDEILFTSLEEIDYLIKMEELRRIQKFTSDMYYEIMGRCLTPSHGFKRRTSRPHVDPVNSLLSLGYSILFGNCCVPLVGAYLDVDKGILREGTNSLILDLIDPLKPFMVDSVVFSIAREYLTDDMYETNTKRCHLDQGTLRLLSNALKSSIDQRKIEENVMSYRDSLINRRPLRFSY